ncbi:phospholipase D-like domain-containing protein [Tardiphaga sp. 538_B7_N1_4]|uniref:phospholipase D-like domain-containing protein n=1 Tax=Tardiphaga sp. 538_B7_N1_4 TaxID=3240778 RepID=UPI003F241F31
MRVTTSAGAFEASAIAGTRAIMIALNCDEAACKGLLGFAFQRARGAGRPEFLRSLKVFEEVEPEPDTEHGEYFTDKFPIQSFLWSDYTAEPCTTYHFEVIPVFGDPTAPELRDAEKLAFTVTTEKEDDGQHGIWFNRGAIASQAYARKFKNHKPTEAEMDNPKDKHTVWLSRGLLEACLDYIDTTKKSEALRACIYEFTYAPIIEALKTKIDDGFDVRLIVHDDKKGKNRKAMKAAGLDVKTKHNGEPVVIWRTRPPIPHNKFIIKLDGDAPQEVWTGSTNITPSGFLGQSNVGHLVHDSDVAEQYLKYWTILSDNPTGKPAKEGVAEISPYPPALVKPGSQTCIFSPRQTASMLNWYADRMSDATSSIMFTAAFIHSPVHWRNSEATAPQRHHPNREDPSVCLRWKSPRAQATSNCSRRRPRHLNLFRDRTSPLGCILVSDFSSFFTAFAKANASGRAIRIEGSQEFDRNLNIVAVTEPGHDASRR